MESERIPCPYCAELIASAATKCRFCGEWLSEQTQPAFAAEIQDALQAQNYEGRGASKGRSGRLFKKEPWTLRPGEKIVARSAPYIRRILTFYLIVFGILAIPSLGLTLLVPFGYWLYYRLKRFEWILTDRRLVLVEGWLTRHAHGASLDKVNEVNYHRRFLQRVLWSTGTVVVETAATRGATALVHCADDDPFRHAIETQLELRRRGNGVQPPPSRAALTA
jgi:hypothetical protein